MSAAFSSSSPCLCILFPHSPTDHGKNLPQLQFQYASPFSNPVPVHPLARSLPLASISGASLPSASTPLSCNKAVEPATGVAFPNLIQHLALSGIGVRAKKILGLKTINVYAIGIYCDKGAAKKALYPKYGLKPHPASSRALYDDFISAEAVNKSLRLVITFGSLSRAQFLNALEERLAPPLKTVGELSTLDAFCKQFDDVTFAKGTEVVFTNTGKQLVTKVDSRNKGTLVSPALNQALFQVYLGPDSVAPEAKRTFGETMEALLSPASKL